MKKLNYLKKLMHDDLKDVDMLLGYAMDFVNDMDKEETIYYIQEANKRIEAFSRRHARVTELAKKNEVEYDMLYLLDWLKEIQIWKDTIYQMAQAL